MGTIVNIGKQNTFAKIFDNQQTTRYVFFILIGLYLLSDLWSQYMQYEGYSKVSAGFTVGVAVVVVGSAIADVYVNWGKANLRTVNDNIESVMTTIYGIMIFIIGAMKFLRPKPSQKEADFEESESILIIVSYAMLVAFIIFAVYRTAK